MSSISTFGTFTTARLGIYASQKALEVVGNNIANINTPGYTRQALNQRSLYMGGADRFYSVTNARVGAGALVTGISQLRDPYLDIRYRTEQASVGAMDTKLAGLEQLATIFDEVGKGEDGEGFIEAQLNGMIEQLQNLVTQGTGKDNYDELVKASASSLVTLFNTAASQLQTLKDNQEKGFQQDLDSVNSILESIRDINVSIRKSQVHGGDALELRDQRNQLIDELSAYVRINVEYGEEDLGDGVTVEKLVIKLADADFPQAPALVDGSYSREFSIREGSTNYDLDLSPLEDAQGRRLVKLPEATGPVPDPDGTDTTDVGDPDPAPDPDVPAADPDAPAAKDPDLYRLGDVDLYGSLQASRELLTEKGEYTTTAELAADPKAATKRGIPYYQKTLDALANKFATVLNDANTLDAAKMDADEWGKYYKTNDAGEFVDANGTVIDTSDPDNIDYSKFTLKDEFSYYNGGALFSNNGNGDATDDPEITAANISISKGWADGPVRLLQSKEPHDKSQTTDNSNILHILYLMTADQEYTPDAGAASGEPYYTGNFQGMLTKICSTLANDTRTTTAMLQNYTASADEIYVDREAVSGVDLNDEAMGMMQYQKSYSAACRLMTTIDDMLDKLINGTGRAGL